MRVCQIFVIVLYLLVMTNGIVFRFEADYTRNKDNHDVWDLPNASDGKALILRNGEPLSLNFCLRTASMVEISNLRFSNGNKTDTVVVKIDEEAVGIFATPTSINSDWNNFMSTGRFPRRSFIDIGWHTIHIHFNGTNDGIAVDYVEIDIDDNFMTTEIAMCQLTCVPDVAFNLRSKENSVGLSYAVQESYKTTCPEVDNVNVPIFNHFVKRYEITAVLPQYRSFSNWRTENTSGCSHLSQFLWTFRDIELTSEMSGSIRSDKATVFFTKGNDKASKLSTILIPQFDLEGKSKGMIDADIGSILRIKFSGMTGQTIIQMRYKGKAAIVSTEYKILTPFQLEASWSIPDFSWTETDLNFIFLYVNSNASLPLSVDTLSLERRPMLPDQVVTLYKSDNVIVEAIFVEFWWLAPDTMQLILSNGHSYNNVSYFRIYRPIPWNSGYAQVFVMYQDGNTRLLPVPPEGVDWIPFGSSVIIGQANPTVVRPYATVVGVHLDLQSLIMNVKYKDGGSAKLKLENSLTETRVVVYDIVFGENNLYPFATFRSMYVSEGNSDVDHVSVNGVQPRHIMEDFGSIMGNSFVFYRKCMSKHLNLSPDIYIDIRETETAVQGLQRQIPDSDLFQILVERIQNNRRRLWTPRIRNWG
ncbi:hypothetical protein CHS0354_006598 [Potamilus streckersoni]|uniref:Uncharacterized protein n=1 Tax=Potamilus streckersoni TaxID=2493646 RepID=A0AAE0W2W6_9BIVA|nr:hypothetical protein CHS0354_006598 [Potamilus streckersoni]